MASSTDFKELFEKYQSEGAKSGLSIVKYCQMNGVVYSHFERWYKKCRAGVVLPVHVVEQNGDMFVFLSKNRQLLKMVRYEHHMYMLYELEYERGYKFMQPIYEDSYVTRTSSSCSG